MRWISIYFLLHSFQLGVLHYSLRAFKAILQADRATYGASDDYEIANVIGNEWQQRVDDVVSGATPQD